MIDEVSSVITSWTALQRGDRKIMTTTTVEYASLLVASLSVRRLWPSCEHEGTGQVEGENWPHAAMLGVIATDRGSKRRLRNEMTYFYDVYQEYWVLLSDHYLCHSELKTLIRPSRLYVNSRKMRELNSISASWRVMKANCVKPVERDKATGGGNDCQTPDERC